MPMPHRTQQQIIKRRLAGKEGSARVKEIRAILDELPNYRNGPYADLRKWVEGQLAETRRRSGVVHRDSIAVPKEGAAQIALVGRPNAGKSSLLQVLSAARVRTGDYAFTTTRPVPALTWIGGVLLQLVEIPGLLPGAAAGRGGGRALLGVLRGADAMVLCHAAAQPVADLVALRAELEEAGISVPGFVAVTRSDEVEGDAEHRCSAVRQATGLDAVAVSVLDDDLVEALRQALWRSTGLVRVHLRHGGVVAAEPVALPAPATVRDVAHTIHHDLGRGCRAARLWGPSARFPGQRVGPDHPLQDGDVVEILR